MKVSVLLTDSPLSWPEYQHGANIQDLVLQPSAVRDALWRHKIRVMLHFERNESTQIGEQLKTIQLFYYLSPQKWRRRHRWTKPESVWSPGVLAVLLLKATDGSKVANGRKEKVQTLFIAGVLNLLLPSREASRWSINCREQTEHAPLSIKNMWADFQYFSRCKFSHQAHRAFRFIQVLLVLCGEA